MDLISVARRIRLLVKGFVYGRQTVQGTTVERGFHITGYAGPSIACPFSAAAWGDAHKIWTAQGRPVFYDWDLVGNLISAAEAGDLRGIASLVTTGTPINGLLPDGHSALHLASKAGQLEAVKLLLQLGADVSVATLKGNTPLHGAAYKGQVQIVRALLNAGADRNVRNADGETPLDRARAHDQVAVCEVLSA